MVAKDKRMAEPETLLQSALEEQSPRPPSYQEIVDAKENISYRTFRCHVIRHRIDFFTLYTFLLMPQKACGNAVKTSSIFFGLDASPAEILASSPILEKQFFRVKRSVAHKGIPESLD